MAQLYGIHPRHSLIRVINFGRNLRLLSSLSKSKEWLGRSWMFLSTNPKTWLNAKQFGADVLILDMEDAVAYRDKQTVRAAYQKAIKENVFDGMRVFFRINSLDNFEQVQMDISALTSRHVHGFILPKVNDASDMHTYDELMTQTEVSQGLEPGILKIIPLIETPKAFFHIADIAKSTQRNVALSIGHEDLKVHAFHKDYSSTYFNLISGLVMAANMNSLQSVGGVFVHKVQDPSAFAAHCQKLRDCGITGVVTLTPYQTILANQIFPHSMEDVKWAKRVVSADRNSAISTVRRSICESEEMIGPPHIEQAENILKYSKMSKILDQPDNTSAACLNRHYYGIKSFAKVGQLVQPDILVTMTNTWRTMWDSSFPSNNITNNALSVFDFGRSFSEIPMQFGLLMTLTGSLTVTEFSKYARFHLGCYNAFQSRPVSSGDTVRAAFRVENHRNTSSKASQSGDHVYSILDSTHWLINQNNHVVFTLTKRTMFSDMKIEDSTVIQSLKSVNVEDSTYYKFMTGRPIELLTGCTANTPLQQGALFMHEGGNVIGDTEMRRLCKLFHITNPHHHDIVKFTPDDILLPGPFVIFAAISNTARDLGKVIIEHIPKCINVNKVNPGDQINTLTYIDHCRPLDENDNLEEISLKHIGIKNCNLDYLVSVGIPSTIFGLQHVKPSEFEEICSKDCPMLLGKICCYIERKIIRVRDDIKVAKAWTFPVELVER